jgi:cytochrome P450
MPHPARHPQRTLDTDLFCDASLSNPLADYQRLRDTGPVVRPDVYAIGRFTVVQNALRDSVRLISGEGVGFNDAFNAPSPCRREPGHGYQSGAVWLRRTSRPT